MGSLRGDQVGASYHLNRNIFTLFDLLLQESTGLIILSYGTGSHIQNFIVSFIDLVVEQTHSFMNVVCFELPHYI